MAEGIVAGVLGEEDEKPDIEVASPMAGAEAFAAAVAAIASKQDPQVALDTSAFLQNQSELLKVQKRYLEQEHGARIHYLRGQAREIDIRRFGLYMRAAFQVFIGLFATAIGIGILIMLYDAVLSRSVWGAALAKHGDLDAAAEKFKEANRRGPHWADPLKAWGDVLVKQGKTKHALEKYQEALRYAPNWSALHDAREAAKSAR